MLSPLKPLSYSQPKLSMASMALLQPRAGPSLYASKPLSPWCPMRSICHCASSYRPILQSFVYLSVFPRLNSGRQRYMNINSSSVPILETGTLRLRESITVQGHTEESKWQSECHPPDFLTKSISPLTGLQESLSQIPRTRRGRT